MCKCCDPGLPVYCQVVATDGVWEVMSCQEVAHFVHRWRKRPWANWTASDALSLEAQERWKLLQPEVIDRPSAYPPGNADALPAKRVLEMRICQKLFVPM